MTIPELLLAIYAAAGVVFLAVKRTAGIGTWRVIAIVGIVLTITSVIVGSHRLEAIPMMIVALIVAAVAYRRSRRQTPPLPQRRRIIATALRFIAMLLVVLLVVADAAFIEIFDPLSNAPLEELFEGPASLDFSDDPWPDAFEKLHDHLGRAYALGEWKRIDWKALHDAAAPKIAEASRTGDRAAYYAALRQYLWSLNDGHVSLVGSDGGLRIAATRGGYGILLIRLDDGRTMNHVLIEGGPAASQGMKWGATILQWNGVPIDEAAARLSTLWDWSSSATNESLRLARLRILTRAPVGTSATVVFQNPDEAMTRTATLVAIDDAREPLRAAGLPPSLSLTDTNIDWRMLPENIGYVKIRAVMPTLPQLLPDRVMQRAVAAFVQAGAKGVVIDVRGNTGGADKLVSMMMGFFVDRRQFFEHVTFYDETTSHFVRQDALTQWTEPRSPNFAGPIEVLVNEWCVSACEGIAFVARQRAGGHVVGFHGTYGSFGMSGAEVQMPEGLTVEYPGGQSLDANGMVQIDSDWRLEGGIKPDIRVPLTTETVRAQFKDGRDVVLETAVGVLQSESHN